MPLGRGKGGVKAGGRRTDSGQPDQASYYQVGAQEEGDDGYELQCVAQQPVLAELLAAPWWPQA